MWRRWLLRVHFLTPLKVFDTIGKAGADVETLVLSSDHLVCSFEASHVLNRHVCALADLIMICLFKIDFLLIFKRRQVVIILDDSDQLIIGIVIIAFLVEIIWLPWLNQDRLNNTGITHILKR